MFKSRTITAKKITRFSVEKKFLSNAADKLQGHSLKKVV